MGCEGERVGRWRDTDNEVLWVQLCSSTGSVALGDIILQYMISLLLFAVSYGW